jgi:hypothetical protein
MFIRAYTSKMITLVNLDRWMFISAYCDFIYSKEQSIKNYGHSSQEITISSTSSAKMKVPSP